MKQSTAVFMLLILVVAVHAVDFTFYDSTSGLPSNDVRCLAEDSTGNLWVGTLNGAAQFDGETWTVFDTSDGLPFNVVHTIMVDRENRIWFGTFNHGVTVYNGTTFVTYDSTDGLLDQQEFACMTVDSANRVWIGGLNGISVFDGTAWTGYDEDDGLEGSVRAIAFDSAGTAFAGTEHGLYRFSYGVDWGRHITYPATEVNALHFDDNGDIWYSGHYDLVKFNEDEHLTCGDAKLVGSGAADICRDAAGDLRFIKYGYLPNGVPTIQPGLTRFDGTDWYTYDITNGLPTYRISAFLIGRDGTKWVGSHDQGIFIFEEYTVPLTVINPNNAYSYLVGDTLRITWTADTSLVDSVHIWLSPDTGVSWMRLNEAPVICKATVLRNELGRLCRYNALIPATFTGSGKTTTTVSNQCFIRISDAVDDSVYDVSDQRFIILPGTTSVMDNMPAEDAVHISEFPVSGNVTFRLDIPQLLHVRIFDSAGRPVASLSGTGSVTWSGGGRTGGVYFYRASWNGTVQDGIVLLLR